MFSSYFLRLYVAKGTAASVVWFLARTPISPESKTWWIDISNVSASIFLTMRAQLNSIASPLLLTTRILTISTSFPLPLIELPKLVPVLSLVWTGALFARCRRVSQCWDAGRA